MFETSLVHRIRWIRATTVGSPQSTLFNVATASSLFVVNTGYRRNTIVQYLSWMTISVVLLAKGRRQTIDALHGGNVRTESVKSRMHQRNRTQYRHRAKVTTEAVRSTQLFLLVPHAGAIQIGYTTVTNAVSRFVPTVKAGTNTSVLLP